MKYQRESISLSEWRLRDLLEWEKLYFTDHHLNPEKYRQMTKNVEETTAEVSDILSKLIVNTFLTALAGVWDYSKRSFLYPFFCSSSLIQVHTIGSLKIQPKGREIKDKLEELRSNVSKNYKARFMYSTQLHANEKISQILNTTKTNWDEKNIDSPKAMQYIKDHFLDNNYYSDLGNLSRRQSVEYLSHAIFDSLDKMMLEDKSNWCGFSFEEENMQKEKYFPNCRPENIMVCMNRYDLKDLAQMQEESFKHYHGLGVQFYGVNFLLPSMAIVMDKSSLIVQDKFDASGDSADDQDLIGLKISKMYKELSLNRISACNVIELKKGQKFEPSQIWKDLHKIH